MHAVDKGARAPNDFEVGVFVVLVEVAYFIAHGDSIRRVFQELALFPVQFEFLTDDLKFQSFERWTRGDIPAQFGPLNVFVENNLCLASSKVQCTKRWRHLNHYRRRFVLRPSLRTTLNGTPLEAIGRKQ